MHEQWDLTPAVSEADHAEGAENAPVTLVEYGDYQCPYCGAAYPIVKRLQARLGPTLRFVFRNCPLVQAHPNAAAAAEFVEAAALQGKFWAAHDIAYEHQDALSSPDLLAYARALKLDIERLQQDLEAAARRVAADLRSGVQSGVNGTPAFFINGVRHEGGWDEIALSHAIEAALK